MAFEFDRASFHLTNKADGRRFVVTFVDDQVRILENDDGGQRLAFSVANRHQRGGRPIKPRRTDCEGLLKRFLEKPDLRVVGEVA